MRIDHRVAFSRGYSGGVRHTLGLFFLLSSCAVAPAPEEIPPRDLRFLEREYAQCYGELHVARLREAFIARFPGEQAESRDRQFEAWWESQVAEVCGPKPVASGSCEKHGIPLTAGITDSDFGLRSLSTGVIRVIDLDAEPVPGQSFVISEDELHLQAGSNLAQYQPHVKRGLFTGCAAVRAFTWTVYCTSCEAELAAGCDTALQRGLIPADSLRFLEREYVKCCDEAEVALLRDSFLSGFPEEESAIRAGQFEQWWESQITRTFGPKPAPQRTCEKHGVPLRTGIARTEYGLRIIQMIYVQDSHRGDGLDDGIWFDQRRYPPITPHAKCGAQLGCRRTSAFSWSLYCASCEAERDAWLELSGSRFAFSR